MKNTNQNQEAYEKAKKRATAKVGFYQHLVVFAAVLLLLLIINVRTNPDVLWVKWPFMGWGIGLLFHGLSVFLFSENTSMMDRMIEREMKK